MKTPGLRVLILCGRSPRHLYVANRLARSCDPVGIVHEARTRFTPSKLAKFLKPGTFVNKVSRWVRDRKRYRGGREASFFFGSQAPTLERQDLACEVPLINHASMIEIADRTRPDVIAVFGTSLIREPLLSRGQLGILNLHGGLSPDYRGADCTFWALHNGEPEKVGCTLHFIDAGIDTGTLIAHISPEVREGDDELMLFWRAVSDAAEIYAQALERLARGETLGRAQPGKGRLYQVKQRLRSHERALDTKLANGMLRGIDLPRRVTWFEPATSNDTTFRSR